MSAFTLTLPDGASGIRIGTLSGDTYFNLTTAMDNINQGFKLTGTRVIWLTKQTPAIYIWATGSFAYQYISPSPI